ncbi:MAG TPA: hypothetical protein VGQ26_28780, partial [Streptosporangiaceae bacterium]|nr:hypothetical protein [Streptosporangiaceae bacterium]
FAQRRLLAELLIDRVIVTDGEVEIRYVLPTSPNGPHPPFCQLRKDYFKEQARLHTSACRINGTRRRWAACLRRCCGC